MRLERRWLETVFRNVTPESVFDSIKKSLKPTELPDEYVTLYNKFSNESFHHFSKDLYSNYTPDEINNFYEVMNSKVEDTNKYPCKSLFNLLVDYSGQVLFINQRYPVVKYSEILNFREITNKLGQNIFTTSYLAYNDLYNKQETYDFGWKAVLSSDNQRLSNILNKGMAENHFHLFGSTQIFSLSWVSAMNHVENIPSFCKKFEQPLSRDDMPGETFENKITNELQRAAIIRQYLFSCFVNNENCGSSCKKTDTNIINMLEEPLLYSITSDVYALRTNYGYRIDDEEVFDYALKSNMDEQNYKFNRALVGERYFMYSCFRRVFSNEFSDLECNLFYLYLVIKTNFRRELVQSNDKVGFQNFSDYQDSKGYFTDRYNLYNKEAINLALNSECDNQNINSVEARITPKKTCRKMRKIIMDIDNAQQQTYNSCVLTHSETLDLITDRVLNDNNPKPKYHHFYVIHFPKRKDTDRNQCDILLKRRHNSLKNTYYTEAKALRELISKYYLTRNRIKAIDGCASEIGCRPEVLCQTIRSVVEYNPVDCRSSVLQHKEPFVLHNTYHAGEDFIGLVDGLRAIYEAIHFVGLKRNDRLGHATALGLNPEEYYKFKEYKITGKKQEMLDSLVWLITYADKKGIAVKSSVRDNIMSKAYEWFNDIFNKNLPENEKIYDSNLFSYLKSYTLRGDPDDCYYSGKYVANDNFIMKHDYLSSIAKDSTRQSQDAVKLHYYYMFDQKVKDAGNVNVRYKIEPEFIKLVEGVQKELQREVNESGLGIECNPSSNKCISVFKDFENHPIFNFNGLDGNDFRMFVSVNTDDLGVFDTSLENEYAILALSLELKKDKEGMRVNTPEQIYSWIDKIRENGINQIFS